MQRNIHYENGEKPYSKLTMRGAFVVQLRTAGQDKASSIEGSVEEVDSGKQIHFRAEDELVQFMRERFAESRKGALRKEGIA